MYNPQTEFRGDEYLFKGLSQFGAGIGELGSDIGQALEKHRKEKEEKQKEQAQNETIMRYAVQNKQVSPEDLQAYHEGSWKQKSGIVNGIMRDMADQMQRQQLKQEEQHKNIMDAYHMAEMERAKKITSMMGQPAYEHPIAPQSSPAPWNRQVGNWTGEGTIHPLPQTAMPPTYTQIPRPGAPPIEGLITPKGGFQQIKPPKLSADEQGLLNWAQKKPGSTTPSIAELPEDLQGAYDWASKNPKHPLAIRTWDKIKAEIVRRFSEPTVTPETPEDTTGQ